jgi:hypothetical protein
LTSENCAEVGATVTTDVPPVAVPLAEDAEDPDVEDALIVREALVPELEERMVVAPSEAGVEEEMPDELLVELGNAEVKEPEVADEDKLTEELNVPADWPASEL